MKIMTEKGLIKPDKSRTTYVYSVTAPPETIKRQLVSDLVDRAFSGAAQELVLQALTTAFGFQRGFKSHSEIDQQTREEKPWNNYFQTMSGFDLVRLGWALINFLWQGIVIALLLEIALGLAGRKNASLRYVLCGLALGHHAGMPDGHILGLGPGNTRNDRWDYFDESSRHRSNIIPQTAFRFCFTASRSRNHRGRFARNSIPRSKPLHAGDRGLLANGRSSANWTKGGRVLRALAFAAAGRFGSKQRHG